MLRRIATTAAFPAAAPHARRAFGRTSASLVLWKPRPLSIDLPKHTYTIRDDDYRMPHLTYNPKDIEDVNYAKHRQPECSNDFIARKCVVTVRAAFDFVTGFSRCYPSPKKAVKASEDGKTTKAATTTTTSQPPLMTINKWLLRAIFLETVAAVPGMVAGMARHLNSLRRMKHDEGWIHKLLEEAENERMHLFFFLTVRRPSILLRCTVAVAQAVFFAANALAYCISPRFAHRFVGFLEEEACHTYTLMIQDIDRVLDAATAAKNPNHISQWRDLPAPMDFVKYYGLDPKTATYRDVVLCIRADEMSHREHNHMFADAIRNNEQDKVKDVLKTAHPLVVDASTGVHNASSSEKQGN